MFCLHPPQSPLPSCQTPDGCHRATFSPSPFTYHLGKSKTFEGGMSFRTTEVGAHWMRCTHEVEIKAWWPPGSQRSQRFRAMQPVCKHLSTPFETSGANGGAKCSVVCFSTVICVATLLLSALETPIQHPKELSRPPPPAAPGGGSNPRPPPLAVGTTYQGKERVITEGGKDRPGREREGTRW